MKCRICGTKLSIRQDHCSSCGTPVDEFHVASRRLGTAIKYIMVILYAASVLYILGIITFN